MNKIEEIKANCNVEYKKFLNNLRDVLEKEDTQSLTEIFSKEDHSQEYLDVQMVAKEILEDRKQDAFIQKLSFTEYLVKLEEICDDQIFNSIDHIEITYHCASPPDLYGQIGWTNVAGDSKRLNFRGNSAIELYHNLKSSLATLRQ